MDITINQLIDYISKFVDYIEIGIDDCREKEYAVQKLEESVFWLTYLNGDGER